MSDIISPNDAAIEALRERERQLDAEIQAHTRRAEVATERREEVRDLIAMLSRKPRARRPRAVEASDAPQSEAGREPPADPMAAFRGEAA
jgi:hypothetical protein